MASLYIDTASGSLEPAAEAGALREVVEQAGSPWLQLSGSLLARSPDGVLGLTRLTRPARTARTSAGRALAAGVSAVSSTVTSLARARC